MKALVTLGVAAWIFACGGRALSAEVGTVEDTSIAEEAPNAGHYGSSQTLYTIGAAGFRAYALLKFDLRSYAGLTVNGSGSLGLYLSAQWPDDASSRTVLLHRVLQPWSEATTTWNSFGITPGASPGEDFAAAPLSAVSAVLGQEGSGYRSWSIPNSLLQSWIDSPTANHGVILVMENGANPYYWRSRENLFGSSPVLELEFAEVPEASTAALPSIVTVLCAAKLVRRRTREPKR